MILTSQEAREWRSRFEELDQDLAGGARWSVRVAGMIDQLEDALNAATIDDPPVFVDAVEDTAELAVEEEARAELGEQNWAIKREFSHHPRVWDEEFRER